MTDEPDNTPLDEVVTDNINPSDDDTAADLGDFDLDEHQDTEDATESDAPDDEDTEGEAEAEPEKVYADEKAVVKLADGTEVPVADLIKGNMMQQAFTRKTQEVANERKALTDFVDRMQRIQEAFVDKVTSMIPPMPPHSLAASDPAKYVAQMARYEAGMEEAKQMISMADTPKEISAAMSEADQKRQLHEANQRLIEMFPETAGGKTREAFFNNVQSVANDLGFSNAELSSTRDPRIFALAHWAAKGMAAEKARTVAKAKVAAAPPATPRKPGQGVGQGKGNADAMRKLRANDSFENALAALSGR